MSDGHFLHCRDCGALFRPSPHDRALEFRRTVDGYTEVRRDDCVDFLVRHARHALETLRPTGDVTLREGTVADPMAVTYWQVTDGAERLLVRGWRDDLTQPLQYCLFPGRLVAEPLAVEIPQDDIRREVDRALYPGVAPERKLRAFVAELTTLVWSLDPSTLEILYDLSDDPGLSVARLPDTALARLAAIARRLFDPLDADRIEAWLTSPDDPDALTVLVRRRVRREA